MNEQEILEFLNQLKDGEIGKYDLEFDENPKVVRNVISKVASANAMAVFFAPQGRNTADVKFIKLKAS